MKYRKLGRTGFEVSEIGFGTWGLGGGHNSYGPVNDRTSKKTLKLAFEKGINFYDTADLYGNGHSEELIGQTFKEVRDEIIIATKIGAVSSTGRFMKQEFSEKYIRRGIEKSLRRLRTSYIDLYQLHSPPIQSLDREEIIRTLHDLRKEGKIRGIGISVRSPDDGLIAARHYDFECIQVNMNLIDHRAVENGLLKLAQKENVGIIARTPLCFGLLTEKITHTSNFDISDHRLNWTNRQLKRWSDSVKLFTPFYKSKNITAAQFALNFCLTFDAISTVIPGMMNPQQVEENIKSSELKHLSEKTLAAIKKIYAENVFFESAHYK